MGIIRKKLNGAGGRTRTGTLLPEPDFESGASTNFTTPARSDYKSSGQLSIAVPKNKPSSDNLSLISVNDFLPKFGALRSSFSVFCTSSPINIIFTAFKQLEDLAVRFNSSTCFNSKGFISLVGSSTKIPLLISSTSTIFLNWFWILVAASLSASSQLTLPLVLILSSSLSRSVRLPTRASLISKSQKATGEKVPSRRNSPSLKLSCTGLKPTPFSTLASIFSFLPPL